MIQDNLTGHFPACRKPMGSVPTSPPSMLMPLSVGCREVSLSACPLSTGSPEISLSLVLI